MFKNILNATASGFILCGSFSFLYAQNPCASIPQGATVPASSGCMPLSVKPADGGPVQTVWVPATFSYSAPQPVGGKGGNRFAAAFKSRELDLGASAFYADPDYGRGTNIDVGVFAAYTGKYIGVELDAADTVKSANGIHEPYIVVGPRFQYRARHFTVFAKVQAGALHFSGASGQANNKQTLVVENFGGGLEFRLSPHVKIRAVDANYQILPTFAPTNLTPFHIGSGLAFSF